MTRNTWKDKEGQRKPEPKWSLSGWPSWLKVSWHRWPCASWPSWQMPSWHSCQSSVTCLTESVQQHVPAWIWSYTCAISCHLQEPPETNWEREFYLVTTYNTTSLATDTRCPPEVFIECHNFSGKFTSFGLFIFAERLKDDGLHIARNLLNEGQLNCTGYNLLTVMEACNNCPLTQLTGSKIPDQIDRCLENY